MQRGRAYSRKQRERVVRKKFTFLKQLGEEYVEGWTHGQPGRLTKSKIHCSCPMCRQKSYDLPSHQDSKKYLSLNEQLKDIQ